MRIVIGAFMDRKYYHDNESQYKKALFINSISIVWDFLT